MSSVDHETMHREHHEVECEHVMWLEDIGRWRTEHRRAASMLAQAQAALLDQDAALEAHAETVRAHELHVQRHERAIADFARGSPDIEDDKLADSHRGFLAEHDQAREAHRRIKMHHGLITAEIRRLFDKVSAAM